CTSPNPSGIATDPAGAYLTWPQAPGYTYTPASGTKFAPHGSPPTVISATGPNGVTCTFTVHVNDNCPEHCLPTVIVFNNCSDSDVKVQCISDVPPAPTGITAYDNCGNDVPVTYNETRSGT